MSFDGVFASAFGLPFVSLICALAIVAPAYMTPYMNRVAAPAQMSAPFPLRSAVRSVLAVFLLAVNLIGLGFAHRLPVASILIAGGLLTFLWLPADGPATDSDIGD